MVDLTQFRRTTIQKINALDELAVHRPYLGMSEIGHSCERFLWYKFHWCYQEILTARMQRLFARGHREEPVIIAELNKVGIRVYDEQLEVEGVHGHVKGHIDGKAIGVIEAPKTEHLAEFKTMNAKAFKEVNDKGVRASKPVYFSQAQSYMGKLKLTRTLFVADNKNDDSMYIERLYFDKDIYDNLMVRTERIILSEVPPERKFKRTWYECKYCSAFTICHGTFPVEQTCRTCKNVDILMKGEWACNKYGMVLATDQQRLGCTNYEVMNGLRV